MIRSLLLVLLLAGACVFHGFAQRTIGTTRDPQVGNSGSRNPSGRPGESRPAEVSAPPPAPTYAPAPIRPQPTTVLVEQAVCCIPPPVVVVVEKVQPPLPEEKRENSVVLQDGQHAAGGSGFDFSAEEVVDCTDPAMDICFAIGEEGPEFVVRADADIQNLGAGESSKHPGAVHANDWSPTSRVHAVPENVYVVWTWDNQFFKFRVVAISDHRVLIEWSQREGGARLSSNLTYRNGIARRDNTIARFGK